MPRITQCDKRTGITYVYEAESQWDPQAKQTRYKKRKLVGHIDPDTGQVQPNRPTRPSEARMCTGATILLDLIADTTGLTSDLARTFPDTHQAILSVAYFLVCEDDCSLTRFSRWATCHTHPFGRDISSQYANEVFASISLADLERFLSLWEARCPDSVYWFYDTTSMSSYTEAMGYIRWGKNMNTSWLPQINLTLLFGQESRLPVYFRRLPGSIPDVRYMTRLLGEFTMAGTHQVKLFMDRGFYSKLNIDALMDVHMKFLIEVPMSEAYAQRALRSNKDELHNSAAFDKDAAVHGLMIPFTWDHEHKHIHAGTADRTRKRAYLHLFHDSKRAITDEAVFSRLLHQLATELDTHIQNPAHEELYHRYFINQRGRMVVNQDAVTYAQEHYGHYALLTNDTTLTPFKALNFYRQKKAIEEAFADIKNRLDFGTSAVSSEATLQGEILCVFVSLILVSWLKNRMATTGLSEKYTVQTLIDKLDTIEQYQRAGTRFRVRAITHEQRELFVLLGFKAPTTS